MQRFRNILAHVNLELDEHPSLSRATRLAKQNDAKLTVISVIDEHPTQAHAVLRSLHLEEKLDSIEQEHRDQLERLVQPIREPGLDVETEVATGSTFVEVIRTALRNKHDLVIKTVSSEGIFQRTFFGSTDMHLLRKCPAPLWLLEPGEPESFRRILIPLDANNEHAIKHQLGMDLLKIGTSLAERDGAELMIVHASRTYEEATLKRHLEAKQFDEYLHSWSRESTNRMTRFLTSYQQSISSDCIHLVNGEPGFVISKFAKDHDVDLVVMGTLGRLSDRGVFIGDTAERILNRLECSVLALKPAGFVSPVQLNP